MFGLTAVQCFCGIVLFFIVFYWIIPKKHCWISFLIITFLFAYLAYKVEPMATDDITRYFHEMHFMRDRGQDELTRCIDQNLFDFKTFRASMYYIYFISQFNDDYLLPAANVFIVYFLGFYCIYKASQKFEISKWNLFLATMFFISTYWYYDSYSGTRNGISFAIAFVCSYQLTVERKFKVLSVIGLIIAALFHSAGIIPVVLLILTEITLNTSGKFVNYLLVFGILAGAAGIRFLDNISDNDFIQGIAGKVDTYEAGETIASSTNFRVNIVVLAVVLLLIIYFSYFLLNNDRVTELKRFYKYSSIIGYFCVGAMFSTLIFMRFSRWILPVIGSLVYMLGRQFEDNYIEEKGVAYCNFYAPQIVSIRVKTKNVVSILFIIFTAVHFWYLCNGSSLVWMHFDWEIQNV